jgi:hypothetical protein
MVASALNQSLTEINEWLVTTPVQIPVKFLGVFAIQGTPAVSNFDEYLEMDFKLKFQPPEENIPGFYEKFVPAEKTPLVHSDKDIY